jgi:hypothetical protein
MLHIEWYGQSAFRLTDGSTTVFIDPFPDMTPMATSGMRWEYPPIGGDPLTIRSTAACSASPGTGSRTSATSGSGRCARSSWLRWARSSCCSCRPRRAPVDGGV